MCTTYSVPSRLSQACGTRCEDTTVPTITACESFFSRSTGMVLVHAAKEAAEKRIQTNPVAIRFNLPRSTAQLINDPTIEARCSRFKAIPEPRVSSSHPTKVVERLYSCQRRKMRAPFVPPKPKELDSATSKGAVCGSLAV